MITDPLFYAVAIPAVVLMGISKSGFGAGFGAIVVPLMALTVPVPQAAAIMLPLLAIMDLMGLAALMRQADWTLLRRLIPAALLGTLIGTALFGVLSSRTVAGVVGAITLVFLAIRLAWPPRADSPPPPAWLGTLLGTVSGFTSFVAHAGGPPISFYLLPLRLAPITFTATLAVLFTAVNFSKWLPYGWLGLIDSRNMATSLVLAPFAPVGVWLGLKIVRRINPTWFYRLFHLGMLLTGVKLVWDAWA
ncbi:sulfite exporter TauE/SafE family protein [Ideonella sp. 4Y11]|uniref:Probable membrane transporter protein n=1 Tax=Ideonella aquatica TaxID=2824119 RepID=A0A940YJE3_9BURK|nr:sulfite exporter TauE/SafE family protein [Ideonella aquatica]MBQ0957331.1 sulfite exporter TauE/SafE family protein [Ideonella aquatica]